MGVQVYVKGPNGLDYVILGKTMSTERIKDQEEVVVVRDVNGVELALIPMANIRFTSPVSDENIPVNSRENVAINLHIKGGENGDLAQVCNLIKYARPFNTMIAEAFNRYEENGQLFEQLLVSVPFSEIRYVDFNYPLAAVETEPPQQTQEVVEEVRKENPKKGPRVGLKPQAR